MKPPVDLSDNPTMSFHIRGVQYLNGQPALVGSILNPNDDSVLMPFAMPAKLAHTMGCTMIELAQLAIEREDSLRTTGKVLTIDGDLAGEVGLRVQERMKLNGSTSTVTWNNLNIKVKPQS